MVSAFYFLCDYVCILIYCPFQSHIMHNKCCVNCRIYGWGHFMIFTPRGRFRHKKRMLKLGSVRFVFDFVRNR